MLFMKKGISDSRMSRCMPEPLERRVLMAAGTPVTLQFEDYPIPGGAVVARDNAGYTGRGYVDYTADNGLVEIPINGVPETGMYELTFRYANGSSSTRPLNVHSSVRPINPRLAFAPTGSWTKWGTVTVQAQLNAGDNEVSLAALGQNGPNLDSLTYRTLPSPLPEGTTVQAEAQLQIGAHFANDHPGYTGEGFIDFDADRGGFVSFGIPPRNPGIWSFEIRYANGSASSRPLDVELDAHKQFVSRLAFPPTGGWAVWKTVTVDLAMSTGNADTFSLMSTGASGPNIDALTFRKAAAQPAVTGETQAEKARLSGARAIVGFVRGSDGGYADFTGGAGSFVEWTLDATAPTTRELTWQYSNGSGSARSLELRVNDRVVDVLSFAPTATWSSWNAVTVSVPLVAGANRVRLTAVGSDGPNLDFMQVKSVTNQR